MFSVLSQFSSKKAAQDCYEGDYQEIITFRKGAIDMNFRIVKEIDRKESLSSTTSIKLSNVA